MLMDQQTKRHRGFGFVSLSDGELKNVKKKNKIKLKFKSYQILEDVVDRICEIHFHTIKNKKVECKKAQPKETVTPATQLQLQKRLLLSGLGLRMPTGAVVGAPTAPPTNVLSANPLSAYPLAAAAAAQVN